MILNLCLVVPSPFSWQFRLISGLLASGSPSSPCWDPSSWATGPIIAGSLFFFGVVEDTCPISRVCCSLSAVSCVVPQQHWSAGRPNISRSALPGSPWKPPPAAAPRPLLHCLPSHCKQVNWLVQRDLPRESFIHRGWKQWASLCCAEKQMLVEGQTATDECFACELHLKNIQTDFFVSGTT